MYHYKYCLLIITLVFAANNATAQFWGAKLPKRIETPKDSLKKGEFTWAPELAPAGPIVLTVSLDDQIAYTYRNGVLIGMSNVSTGRKGHETPTGVFVTLLKDANHHSSKYNNASMPFTQKITKDGIALHAGGLPGYPTSHGCIHLPSEFARLLFKESPLGMTVMVTNQLKSPEMVDHPAFLSPIVPGGKIEEHERLSAAEDYRWQPAISTTGPVTMLISRQDKRLVIMRNGLEIGRCKVSVANDQDSIGTYLYVAHEKGPATQAVSNNEVSLKWLSLPLADLHYGSGNHPNPMVLDRIKIPDAFLTDMNAALVPGTVLMLTDAPILAKNSGKELSVLSSNPRVR